VVLVRTDDRIEGIRRALAQFGGLPLEGKSVVIKPNFNSADPFPGSTHPDTLRVLVEEVQSWGATQIVVADRSGMGDTVRVMGALGVPAMANAMGFEHVALDRLPPAEWEHYSLEGSHWQHGLDFPRLFNRVDAIVQTCCLKTHRYGGHFTLSLKNSVGMVAKFAPGDGYNYMHELHSSPNQRLMIAEINQLYRPALIVLDGMKAFTHGGPARGTVAEPGVILVGTDRIAVDAVGVAILRLLGTTQEVARGPIFEQEQIRRATELGLGVTAADQIHLVTADEKSARFAGQLQTILQRG